MVSWYLGEAGLKEVTATTGAVLPLGRSIYLPHSNHLGILRNNRPCHFKRLGLSSGTNSATNIAQGELSLEMCFADSSLLYVDFRVPEQSDQ